MLLKVTHVFESEGWPKWAHKECKNAWAPEIHLVNGNYQVYFSMRQHSDDQMAIGVAISTNKSNPFGPYKDIGHPIIQHPTGAIDVTWFRDPQYV